MCGWLRLTAVHFFLFGFYDYSLLQTLNRHRFKVLPAC